MAKYLVLYETTAAQRAAMAAIPPEQAAAGMAAWMAWGQRAGSHLVDMGSPVTDATDADTQVSGYSILEAGSAQELAGLLEGHPHSGAGCEIATLEFLPIPGM
jgi:hypothetical protein